MAGACFHCERTANLCLFMVTLPISYPLLAPALQLEPELAQVLVQVLVRVQVQVQVQVLVPVQVQVQVQVQVLVLVLVLVLVPVPVQVQVLILAPWEQCQRWCRHTTASGSPGSQLGPQHGSRGRDGRAPHQSAAHLVAPVVGGTGFGSAWTASRTPPPRCPCPRR